MSKIWKFGLRWISLLGLAGILLISNGCGDDDDDDDRDTTPDAFVIAPLTNVALSAEVTSAPITVTGINDPTTISVTNGTYSIGTGPFVATQGTVTNNQTVRVRHTASAVNNTPTTSTLNIGGVTAPFTSFTVPAASQDISPAPFTFTPLIGTALSRSLTSNAITVSGITAPAPIFITGGTYSINGGTFTSNPGTVTDGQTVLVRINSSATNNTVATANLTIGDQEEVPFTVTTQQAGGTTTTPAAFTFTNMTSVALSTTVTSAPITVSGVTAATTPISVSGGTYSIGTGPFTSAAGTISNNQTVRVQHTSAATAGAEVATILNIGGVTGTFRSTTELPAGADTTPNAFTFTPQTDVALGATATSNAITVSGINAPAAISVTGGSYSIDNGAFVTTAGTVNNGQTVTVRHTAASTNSTPVVTRLTIGGVSANFTSTTIAAGNDTTPDAFTFTPQTNVALNTVVTSAPITVTGINAAAPITITGGTYSIAGGPFTAAAGTVTNGQTVTVRHTSSATNATPTTTTLNIGGVTATFTSTTQVAGVDAAALYQARCASCHRLGTVDPTGFAPNLSNVTQAQMQARFPTPGVPGHVNITLSAAEIAALTTYFQAN